MKESKEFYNKETGALIKSKCCGRCKVEKPFTEFRKSKSGLYALYNFCIICQDKNNQEAYQRNKDKHKQEVKEWNEDHAEHTKLYKLRSYYKKKGKKMPKRPPIIPDAEPIKELDF